MNTVRWLGGRGVFRGQGEAGAIVCLKFLAHRPGGATESHGQVAQLTVPGEHEFTLPPGEISFDVGDKGGRIPKVIATFGPAPTPQKQPTLEQRVSALERRR